MTLPTKVEVAFHEVQHAVEAGAHDVATFLHPIRNAVGAELAVIGTDVRAAFDAELKALEPTLTAEAKLAVEAFIKAGVEALVTHGI